MLDLENIQAEEAQVVTPQSEKPKNFNSFMKRLTPKTVDVQLDAFPEPIELKVMTPKMSELLMKQSYDKRTKQTDNMKFAFLALRACMVYPDLDNAELQDAYQVQGATDLIDAMFTNDEFGTLMEAITGDTKSINEEIDDAKNY